MDGAFLFANYNLFLEIQENRPNHFDQKIDEIKKAVVLSGGDDIIYFRIGIQLPEEKDPYRTHIWFYENILKPKIITGLLQSSEPYRSNYISTQFNHVLDQEIERCSESPYKNFLTSQLLSKSTHHVIEEIMNYAGSHIFTVSSNSSYCVPILRILNNTSMKASVARQKLKGIPYMESKEGVVLLTLQQTSQFLLMCRNAMKINEWRSINLIICYLQPIFNDIIQNMASDLNQRCTNMAVNSKTAIDYLKCKLRNEYDRKIEHLNNNQEIESLVVETENKLLKNRLKTYQNKLKKNGIKFDTMGVKKSKYIDVMVLHPNDVPPGEPILGGIEDFPLIKRRSSDPDVFLTDKEVLKIMENYTNQAVAATLTKEITSHYLEDMPNILPDIYLNIQEHEDSSVDKGCVRMKRKRSSEVDVVMFKKLKRD